MSVPLPGRQADQMEVTIEGDRLVVAAPLVETEDEGFSPVHIERPSKAIRLRWTLPEDANADSVQASLTDGWLRVEVSRKVRPAPRSIPVVAG
mgnify:CR=1 FL=1